MEEKKLLPVLEKIFGGKAYIWKSKNQDWIFMSNSKMKQREKDGVYKGRRVQSPK